MKSSRAALAAVIVVVIAIGAWFVLRKGGAEGVDLLAHFDQAKKQGSGAFTIVDATLGNETKKAIAAPANGRITFHVKVGVEDVTTTAPTFNGISFITYREDLKGNVTCGPLPTPMEVYVTWKPDPASGAKITIAVEFLPKGKSVAAQSNRHADAQTDVRVESHFFRQEAGSLPQDADVDRHR